jgi:hypothetical protein
MPKMISSVPRQWAVMLECGHEATTIARPDPTINFYCQPCVDAARRKREAENKEIDDALRGVAQELRRRGINAEYRHSGGGCMGVLIEVTPQHEWLFGLADVCWGGDFSDSDNGHIFSVESSYPSHTKYETVADWIWTYLALVPFIDPISGVQIENPYWDPTRRFPVDPWEVYGIPYPAGIIPHHLQCVDMCDNCGEYFQHLLPNRKCTRCQQPDPANQA